MQLLPREVNIDSIRILEFNPPCLVLHIRCGKGTYIRSIANDLGNMLGCRAYLKDLCRNRCGLFDISEAYSLETIKEYASKKELAGLLHPIDFPLQHWPSYHFSREQSLEIISGRAVNIDNCDLPIDQLARAYDSAGKFIAVMKFINESAEWHPEKVFIYD